MKWVLFSILSVLVLSSVSSCGEKKESALKLNAITNESFILPGDSNDCTGTSQTGPRLVYPVFEITFSPKNDDGSIDTNQTLYLAALRVKFKGGNKLSGDFTCDLGGDYLDSMFAISGGNAGSTTSGEITVSTTGCEVKCYGIKPKDENVPFRLIGEAKMQAYSVDADKNQKAFTAKATVFARFEP